MKYLIAFLILTTSAFDGWTGLISSELALATMTQSVDRVPRSECTACKGTGKVKAGDGQTVVWRACDKCYDDSESGGAYDEAHDDDESDNQGGQQILFFTASWCPPCQRIKTKVFLPMMEVGWKVADFDETTAQNHICIVDYDKHPELVKQFNVGPLPTFIVVDAITCTDELARHVGYLDSHGIRKLWDDAEG